MGYWLVYLCRWRHLCCSKWSQRWSTSGFFWDGFLLIAIRWEVHVHINWVHLLIVLLQKCLSINSSVLPFQLGLKNDGLRIDSGKRINLIVQGSHDSWHLAHCKLFFFVWLKFTSSVKYFRRSEDFVADIQGWWQETQLWSLRPAQGLSSPLMAAARAIRFAVFESAVSVNDWWSEWLSTPIEGFVYHKNVWWLIDWISMIGCRPDLYAHCIHSAKLCIITTRKVCNVK